MTKETSPVLSTRKSFENLEKKIDEVVNSPNLKKAHLNNSQQSNLEHQKASSVNGSKSAHNNDVNNANNNVSNHNNTSKVLSSASTRCHGRVKDLESMVPAQWWKTVFADSMYLKTDGDCVEDPVITKEEIDLLKYDPEIRAILKQAALKNKKVKVLDLCCGQGRHSLQLAKEFPDLNLFGHDQSAFLIELARHRAVEQNLTSSVVFTVGDCRDIPYEDNMFDLVLVMGNSFGYFASDDGDQVVLQEIKRVLAPGGRVVLDLTDGGYMRKNFAERSWEWIDDTTFACRERQLSKDRLRLVSREVITDTTKGVIRDQFYQERLYTREELHDVLETLGYEISTCQEGLSVDMITSAKELSQRNEDLGMMEQRMLLKGTKPHSTKDTSVVDETSESPNIAAAKSLELNGVSFSGNSGMLKPFEDDIIVILGDPSKSCFGKLNNTWNKEDLETRQKLTDALYEIGFPKEKVKIVSDHNALVKSLSETSVPFVFNLCDEGFDNDALKELHVPALLEMLNIPYSGAGPNCLAYCYDKGLVNRSADAIRVHTPRETFYLADINTPLTTDLEHVHEVIDFYIKYPAFVKPLKGDNSLGITGRSIVHNKEALDAYLQELQSIGIRNVIVQEYLQGTEYGVGMVGNSETGFHFFPILEIDYSRILDRQLAPILGFESKWDPTSPYWTEISYKRAQLSPDVEEYLRNACIALWERFGLRDYGRFDFRCDFGTGSGLTESDNGTIKLLEVNPNPGWCWDGKLTYMAKLQGHDYKDVIKMIIEAAYSRINREIQLSSTASA